MLFLLFLIIDLYFSILAVVAQIFNPIAEFVIPVGTPSKKSKSRNRNISVIVKTKITMCTTWFRVVQPSFVLLTDQLIMVCFFHEIIFYYFYIFQSNFLAYLAYS